MSYQFMGFRRPDGRVGARNLVGVIPSVTCANDVAQAIITEVQGTVGSSIPSQIHRGCIREVAKHEPENEAANEPASSMFSALTSCRATL